VVRKKSPIKFWKFRRFWRSCVASRIILWRSWTCCFWKIIGWRSCRGKRIPYENCRRTTRCGAGCSAGTSSWRSWKQRTPFHSWISWICSWKQRIITFCSCCWRRSCWRSCWRRKTFDFKNSRRLTCSRRTTWRRSWWRRSWWTRSRGFEKNSRDGLY